MTSSEIEQSGENASLERKMKNRTKLKYFPKKCAKITLDSKCINMLFLKIIMFSSENIYTITLETFVVKYGHSLV